MISIPFKYKTEGSTNPLMFRVELLIWVREHNGRVVRSGPIDPMTSIWPGKIRCVEFDDEDIAILYKLKFGQ
jgi:hypothetical protein